jgi:hypothetical protein
MPSFRAEGDTVGEPADRPPSKFLRFRMIANKRNPRGIFLDQNAVEPGIRAQRAYDVMRVTGETVAAQELQIVEFLAHPLTGVGFVVAAAHEELADYLGAAVALLVEIDFAVLHAKDAEVGSIAADSYLRQDVLHQIGMQRIVRGEMSKILF